MHIFFSGIGGTGIGPLALIAHQAGYTVSGSDKQHSNYIEYLKNHGLTNISIGQTTESIAAVHASTPIDWFVYSSALPKENPNHPEMVFAAQNNIKHSKRDEFLNHLLDQKNLRMIAIAGTHGKTTTTAMAIWLCKQLGMPISYSVGAKMSFGDMGEYNPSSQYFVYECDEYDRNFLSFSPYVSMITGVDWDHADIYPTREGYEAAFATFTSQSERIVAWQSDTAKLGTLPAETTILDDHDPAMQAIQLAGEVNRRNAWQVAHAISSISGKPVSELVPHLQAFPGLSRRFEQLIPNLITDYAHTPRKIEGALQLAHELAGENVVVVYEGLHNTRQHFIEDELAHLFDSAKQLYVVPSYLAREDPNLALWTPQDIVDRTSKKDGIASQLDASLKDAIAGHLQAKDLVLCLTAGGGGSLDEWLRKEFVA